MHDTLFPITNAKLPVYVIGLGSEFIQRGTRREKGYEHYQWIQTISGAGVLEAENVKLFIREGESVLIPPDVPHAYYPIEQEWIHNWIIFDGEGVNLYLSALGLSSFILIKSRIDTMVSQMIRNVIKKESVVDSPVSWSAWMITFLETLKKDIIAWPQKNKCVYQAVTYIHNHYSSMISMEDMARISGLSPQHFCKIFYQEMKMRPFEYVNRVRVAKGKEILIKAPDMLLEQVANAAGFSSASYFCRIFKKYEGISPARFKNMLI